MELTSLNQQPLRSLNLSSSKLIILIIQSTCSYSVTAGSNICTLRLDFAEFDLAGPTDNSATNLGGRCTTDHFNIIRSYFPLLSLV